MEFEEYLTSKKISVEGFREGDSDRFAEFSRLFAQMHPDSFTAQKLFLINGLRRQFPITQSTIQQTNSSKNRVKPKIALPKKQD